MKKLTVLKEIRLIGSMTIEASLIMPVVFISIVAMIAAGFKLHDIVIGNMTANEAAELYNHLPEEAMDAAAIESYGEARLAKTLSGMGYSVNIEEYKEGSRVRVSTEKDERVYEDAGSRPEKLMRKLTLIDVLADKKQ